LAFPKPAAAARKFFDSIVPPDPRVTVRPMFGNLAGFLNGHMFLGIFGDAVFVRLGEGDRRDILKDGTFSLFEPLKGRPMGEYVSLPSAWAKDPAKARPWVAKSVRWVGAMPPTEAKLKGKKAVGRGKE
jgi:TfoX/Sxy family transcriptional regulator of competence genes